MNPELSSKEAAELQLAVSMAQRLIRRSERLEKMREAAKTSPVSNAFIDLTLKSAEEHLKKIELLAEDHPLVTVIFSRVKSQQEQIAARESSLKGTGLDEALIRLSDAFIKQSGSVPIDDATNQAQSIEEALRILEKKLDPEAILALHFLLSEIKENLIWQKLAPIPARISYTVEEVRTNMPPTKSAND